MINVSVSDLVNVAPIFQQLATKPLAGAVAFKIARLIREINKETIIFEESYQKIIEKYGTRDENGNFDISEGGIIKVIPEKIAECNSEVESLMMMTIEINASPISIHYLEDIEITPSQAMALEAFVE